MIATSVSMHGMSYNQVNQIPEPLTIKWDTTHDFFFTHYQGTAYNNHNRKQGAIVLSVEKPSVLARCFAKKKKQAEIRFLVINEKHDEEMVLAALRKLIEIPDMEEVFITFAPDDHLPIMRFMDWGFYEDKAEASNLIDQVYNKLGLQDSQEDQTRRKFVCQLLRDEKED